MSFFTLYIFSISLLISSYGIMRALYRQIKLVLFVMCVVNNFAPFSFEFYVILCWAEMFAFCYLSVLVFPLCFLNFVSCLERHFPFQDFFFNLLILASVLTVSFFIVQFFDPSEIYIDRTGKEEFRFLVFFFPQLSQDFNTFQT